MNFSQILNQLMDERGVTAYKMWKDTGISQSIIGKWRVGEKEPTSAFLAKVAEYFGVSTDCLLGNEQQKKPATKSDELDAEIMKVVSQMTEDQKAAFLAGVKSFRQTLE